MRSFRSFAALEADSFQRPTAVAIGKFDGVHLGHQAIVGQLLEIAQAEGLEPTVFTFSNNPLQVLQPHQCPPALMSAQMRMEKLARMGVSACLMVEFTSELCNLAPEQFIADILVGKLHAKAVLVGADFRFGFRGQGTVATLQQYAAEYGYRVHLVADVVADGERISATAVRKLLVTGAVERAAKLLGRFQQVRGLVVHGAARGRELGFRTANLAPDFEGLAPAHGVYACRARVRGINYAAAVSIGTNPTFTPTAPSQVEVHLVDFSDDIYGELISVEFITRLRGMETFSELDALIAQMHDDVQKTRAIVADYLLD